MPEPHDRNVYILGAGFSAGAGAPLIHNFLDVSLRLLLDPASGLDEIEKGQFGDVFRFRREIAQAREKVVLDLDNIEQLFGLIDVSERLQGSDERRKSMEYLIAKTLQLSIRDKKRDRVTFTHPGGSSIDDLVTRRNAFVNDSGDRFRGDMYKFFAAVISGALDPPATHGTRRDSVITFNYDLVVEDALRRVGAEPDYGLEDSSSSAASHATARRVVPVLKLHGSTNWAICAKCRNGVRVLEEKVTENPGLLREMQCLNCGERSYHPLLIPPSWDKSEHRDIMSRVWQRAVGELAIATRICVIGYSMPEADAFFKYLMTISLARNDRLFRFIVVDPALSPAPGYAGGETESVRPLGQKYAELLDPLFQRRRFEPRSVEFSRFLAQGGFGLLGRADGVGIVGIS